MLKTIDFVCSEGLGSLPMLALCASIAVMVQQCVSESNKQDEEEKSPLPGGERETVDSGDGSTTTQKSPRLGEAEDDPPITPKLSTSPDEKKRANKRLQQS